MRLKHIWIAGLVIFLLTSSAMGKVIDFEDKYQDSNGNWLKENDVNLIFFPRYTIEETTNDYIISRMGNNTTLPKRTWISYTFQHDKIIPKYTINNYAQINSLVTKVNATAWYLTVPFSASHVRSVTDDLIDMGVFRRTTSISVQDSNTTPNFYYTRPKVIGGDIRLYFNPVDYSSAVYPLILTENTITVNNATTSGFTTSNISLNGSRWTDSGQLAINLNASYLTGLVGYWSMDETTETTIHNVNTESGLVNTTNQGTWNGNTTLNYTTGRIGNAGNFDGVNDYVHTSDASTNIITSVTTLGWIKIISNTNAGVFGQNYINAEYSYGVRADGGSSIYGRWYNSSGAAKSVGVTVVSNNVWYFVAAVYDNSSNLGIFYINGVEMGNISITNGLKSTLNGFELGTTGTMKFFNGSIDEVHIYNRALTAPEIAELYNRSMRTQAMPVISNQSASSGTVINRTRITYTGQDAVNNISIYARQNGTTAWNLVQNNISTNTWIDTILSNNLDYGIQMNGNGSNTPFFSSLEYDETPAKIYFGTGLSNNITSNGVENYSRMVNLSSDVEINASITPSSDNISVNVTTWNTTGDHYKKWNESSSNASVTTQHIIGDFPANTNVQIKRDGVNYAQLTSNSTGYINWTYSGGYSEHQFEAEILGSETTISVWESDTQAIDLWTDISGVLKLTIFGLVLSFIFIVINSGVTNKTMGQLVTICIGIVTLVVIYVVIPILGSLLSVLV